MALEGFTEWIILEKGILFYVCSGEINARHCSRLLRVGQVFLKVKAEPNSCCSLKVLQQSLKPMTIEVKETQTGYLS